MPQRMLCQNRSCSTPCGISGLAGVSMIGYSTIEQIRAQRLAASVVWQGPPSPGILMPPCWKCSTPCGISGLAGGYGKGGDVSSGNACSTPCGISGLAGRAVLAGGVPGDRAQRLAASVVWQALVDRIAPVTSAVLNALRHQWFGRIAIDG